MEEFMSESHSTMTAALTYKPSDTIFLRGPASSPQPEDVVNTS